MAKRKTRHCTWLRAENHTADALMDAVHAAFELYKPCDAVIGKLFCKFDAWQKALLSDYNDNHSLSFPPSGSAR